MKIEIITTDEFDWIVIRKDDTEVVYCGHSLTPRVLQDILTSCNIEVVRTVMGEEIMEIPC